MEHDEPSEVFAKCVGFRHLQSEQRSALVSTAQRFEWTSGDMVVRLGEPPDSLHLITSGYFDARDERGQSLALLRAGDVVGESHLLLPGPATADVVAITDGSTLGIAASDARSVLVTSPEATLDLASLAIARTRRSRLRSLQQPRVIGVAGDRIGAKGPKELIAALAETGLEIIENPSQPVDSLLVIGATNNAVHATRRMQIHETNEEAIDDALHMLVSGWEPHEIERIVRLVTGGARVAVFSGGGIRAAAHIGILSELRAKGIDFDAAIGVSAGGFAALGVGFQIDSTAIEELGRRWANGVRLARDLGPTGQGIFTGRSFTETCQAQLGSRRLEHAERPCVLLAADATARRPHPWTSGPAWLALRSSTSIPGVFPPIRYGDRLLVDGGVVDNLPTTLAHNLFPEPEIFAMDVGLGTGVDPAGFSEDGIASRRRVAADIPQLIDLLTSLATQPSASPTCSHLLRPDIHEFSLLSLGSYSEAVDAGRRCAKEWLANPH